MNRFNCAFYGVIPMTSENLRIHAAVHASGTNQDVMMEAADEIDRLNSRVAELERDAKRLDWFANRAFMAYRSRDIEHGTLVNHVTLVDEDKHRFANGRRGIIRATFRECIDAAMEAE